MKFTLHWLRDHLETSASMAAVAEAMTMAGLEVEEVSDPGAKLAAFTVARVVEAAPHPNADRLRVCQVDTVDGRKEIVCGAANARAGLTTVYAPLGAYIPGSGVTLAPKPVRGVVSNGMLCSAAELEVAGDGEGILELPDDLPVGAPVGSLFGTEPVIDFEVTPNRPDWLGVQGVARDLAAAGVGRLIDRTPQPIPGRFPCPVEVRIAAPEMCSVFAGRLIRNVRNGPSPPWLQDRLRAIGLRPINALVDVSNFLSYDRARPLHVYDAALLSGEVIVARRGHPHERLIALDAKTYALDAEMCVIADGAGPDEPDGARPIGLGGVMGGSSTGCTEATVDVFVESAVFDPLVTAQTGRRLAIASDAQYRFARGVDPEFVVPGLELATALIVEFCGGEPSQVTVAGAAPPRAPGFEFDPAYVQALTGLAVDRRGALDILTSLGFAVEGEGDAVFVTPPSWRRDVEGPADLVEEVARIVGYGALPSTPLPVVEPKPGGVLTALQARARTARRVMAAAGYAEAVTWSFTARDKARLFGGGADALVLENPIAADLDCMRPSALPNLIEAAGRNAARGFPDAALFEIGPLWTGDRPQDQAGAVTALTAPHPPRRWDGAAPDPLFALKADLFALLEEIGAPVASLQTVQGSTSAWWIPGRSAALQLGPKTVLAEFGELHPRVLKALDVTGPMYGFELRLGAVPEPKRRGKSRPALKLSPLMPLSRDFAFVVPEALPAADLVRAVQGADKALIASARVFDLYQGPGVPEGSKSLAVEVLIQPRDKTLAEAEIEALSARVVAAAEVLGARLRS